MEVQAQIYPDNNQATLHQDPAVPGVGFSHCEEDLLFLNIPAQKQQEYYVSLQQLRHLQFTQEQQQQQYLLQRHQVQQLENQTYLASSGFRNHAITNIRDDAGAPIKNTTIVADYNDNIADTSNITTSAIAFSRSIVTQMKKQHLEIVRYINLQSQRLKLILKEQTKQQFITILRKVESKASILLSQKEGQIEQLKRRAFELADFMRKMEEENRTLKRIAVENEATITTLTELLRERQAAINNDSRKLEVEDAESCCEVEFVGETDVVEQGYGHAMISRKRMRLETPVDMNCRRSCSCGNSCVVVLFLPCRHLCSCKDCEPFLNACPVCNSQKQGSIEVIIS